MNSNLCFDDSYPSFSRSVCCNLEKGHFGDHRQGDRTWPQLRIITADELTDIMSRPIDEIIGDKR